MTPPRISRNYMDDTELARARHALLAHMASLGAMQHRFSKDDDREAVYALKRDEDAVGVVLGMILNEQRLRLVDDYEASIASLP